MVNLIKVRGYLIILKKKFKAIKTREPGGTKSSELIRNLIPKITLLKIKKKNLISTQIHCCI